MICGSCGGTNEPGRKFCGDCGARLAVACRACGTSNPPSARFCGECGVTLASVPGAATPSAGAPGAASSPVPPAPAAERRLVSVLFADLVSFTTFAEGRDPEDVRETLTGYFDLARQVIERYGGTVEKFIGDAVMAVWGAPTAQENDAERAVRAALELVGAVATLGPAMRARAGVLTGEAAVTVGAVGQGLVAGDLVNTASRLQAAAEPGSVLVGEVTQRAAGQAIAFEPAGEQLFKGRAAPVAAWRALRVVAEVGGRRRSEALEAPFVGRDDEMRLLKDLFHATGRDRRMRSVSLVGQAGIGKSRLAWEFEKYLDGLVETVYWHHGRSPSIGGGLTFWALGEMVRGRFGLAESDDDRTTRARIAEELPRWVPDEAERRWIEPALLTLLGVEGDSRPGHEQLFGAWRGLFERIAGQGTVVLVFEDLHWADDGLIAFIEHLAEWSRAVPILLITLARPELLERHPDWGAGRRHFTSLPLEPLPDPAMRLLLAGLVPGLPVPIGDAIVNRADGIPLYAVETVRMLVTDGRLEVQADGTYRPLDDLSDLAVPATLHSLIAARLDLLDPLDRAILQAGSVVGHSFTLDALAAVVPDPAGLEARLGGLVRRELLLLDADPRSPERGQYAFVQGLVREVAYGTLAKADRRHLHLAAARYFETVGDEQVAGALAAQYLAAWTATPEGPEADALAGQARIALRAAAERAARLGSMDQAVRSLRQALEVTEDEADRAVLLERAGELAAVGGRFETANELLVRAGELCHARGERSAEARVIALRAEALLGLGRTETGLALLDEAAAAFEDLGQDPGQVAVLAQLARFAFFAQQLERAVDVADRTLPMAERLDLLPVVADLLVTRGTALASGGREYEGLAVLEGGLKLAAANGLTATELRARMNLSGLLAVHDVRAAVETARVGVELAIRLGLKAYVPGLAGNAAVNALETGDWEWADGMLARTIESAALDDPGVVTLEFFGLGTRLNRGDPSEETVARCDRFLAEQVAAGEHFWAPSRHYLRAQVAHAAGSYREALDEILVVAPQDAFNAAGSYAWAVLLAALESDGPGLADALDGLRATGSNAPLSKLAQRIGCAAQAAIAGRQREALDGFRDCLATARDLGLVWSRAQLGLAIGQLLDAGLPDVRSALEDARETFVALRARPWIERVDAAIAAGATSGDGVTRVVVSRPEARTLPSG